MPASSPHSALIIGASRGLGLALAQEYLKRGWRVVGTVRGRAVLHDLADRSAGRLRSKFSMSSSLRRTLSPTAILARINAAPELG
jgi:NAD(P)-dependent dehydrogenase (short-subunit alcohol dehydrogenase family)